MPAFVLETLEMTYQLAMAAGLEVRWEGCFFFSFFPNFVFIFLCLFVYIYLLLVVCLFGNAWQVTSVFLVSCLLSLSSFSLHVPHRQ